MTNREKLLIAIIIILGALAFYYAFKCSRKIEVHFSKPVYPVGNYNFERDLGGEQKI